MTMTVSTRIKGKSASLAAGQRRHDLRLGRIPKYVSIGKIRDNSIILKTPLEARIRRECEELRALQEHERDMKSNAAIVTVGIITFGKLAQPIIMALPKEEQDAIYLDIAERIAKKGDTKLLGLVVHRDESAPHAHYTLRGVNNQGFPMSEVFKAKETAELQDLAGQVLADHGHPEITRGTPKKQRIKNGEPTAKWVNMTVHELHEAMPRQLDALHEIEKDAKTRINDIYERQENAENLLNEKLNKIDEADEVLNEKLNKISEADEVLNKKLDKIAEADEFLQEKIDKIKYYDGLAAKSKANYERQKTIELEQNKNLEKLDKRIKVYENRRDNLINDVANLEKLEDYQVREALENAGLISKVVFAGSENTDDSGSQVVNHDLDWD